MRSIFAPHGQNLTHCAFKVKCDYDLILRSIRSLLILSAKIHVPLADNCTDLSNEGQTLFQEEFAYSEITVCSICILIAKYNKNIVYL